MNLLAEAATFALNDSSQVRSLLPEVESTGSAYHRLPIDGGRPGRDFSSQRVHC